MKSNYRIFELDEGIEKKILHFLYASIAFTLPFKISWNSFFCILLLIFWILFQKKTLEIRSMTFKLSLLLSGLFFITIVGLVYTENLEDGFFRIQQKSVLFIFPLILSTVNIDFKRLGAITIDWFIIGLLMGCVFTGINSVFVLLKTGDTSQFFGHNLADWINLYPYIFSLYCLLAILFLLERLRSSVSDLFLLRNKSLLLFLILFFTVFIFLLSVKQIIIGWLLVSFVYLFVLIKSKRYIIIIYSLLFLSLISATLVIPTLNQKAEELLKTNEETILLDQDSSLGKSWSGIALRKAIWSCSMDVIKENIWFGVGSGDGQDELQKAYELRKFYFASRYNRYNTHNEYLQVLVNFGLMGLFMLLISFLVPLYIFHKDLIFVMFTLCILIVFFTESMFEVNKGLVIYALFNSLLIFERVEVGKNERLIGK